MTTDPENSSAGVIALAAIGVVFLSMSGCKQEQPQASSPKSAATGPANSVEPSPEIQALIRSANAENDQCRGGSDDDPATLKACNRRHAVMVDLERRGWCWGGGEEAYRDRWLPCSDDPNYRGGQLGAAPPFTGADIQGASNAASAGSGGEEQWVAYSKTAISITGDIRLSPTHLIMAGHTFPLEVASDIAKFQTGDDSFAPARVLRVTRDMNPKLLNGNTFGCGEPVRWIGAWREDGGKRLALAGFGGAKVPRSVRAAGFCGLYYYMRP